MTGRPGSAEKRRRRADSASPKKGRTAYYQGATSRVLAVDPQGSGVWLAGDFNATVDFGGGPLTPQATAADCWLAKYTP